jgi:integrase/recombinase XerC
MENSDVIRQYVLEHKHAAYATEDERGRFEGFLEELRGLGRRGKTLQSYAFDWLQFSRWYEQTNGECFDIGRLSSIDIQDYKAFLMAQGSAAATINRRLVFLKRYARFGVERGAVRRELQGAFQQVQGVRRQALAPKSVEIRQVRRLLKEVELAGNLRDETIIYLLLYTGLRVGELVRVLKDDVELSEKKGAIHIRAEIGKGGRERTVPIPLEARRRLQAYLDGRKDQHPELFLGQRGPLKEDAVVRILRKYAEKVGVAMTPHLLRHTFAYQYLEKNANDLVGLASILGHESLNTTRLYTQKRLEDLQESAERVGYWGNG